MSAQVETTLSGPVWQIRRAGLSDIPVLLTLFDAATAWLVDHELTGQWGDIPPSQQPDFSARLCDWVENHHVLLALTEAQQAHGCIVLGQAPPPYLAPTIAQSMMLDAVYIYSFASLMQVAARGVGAVLLAQASCEAQAQGKHYLRLDCWADNTALCDYYQRAGFTRCGSYDEDGWRGALMEKRLDAPA